MGLTRCLFNFELSAAARLALKRGAESEHTHVVGAHRIPAAEPLRSTINTMRAQNGNKGLVLKNAPRWPASLA